MLIRKYDEKDLKEVLQLFYNTVHSINIKDYTLEQVNAWAPKIPEKKKWENFLYENKTSVAVINQKIVGFSDLREDGYLNTMYVSKNHQGQGIATILLSGIEQEAQNLSITKLTTEASITAKDFFRKRGFNIVEKQNKKHNNMVFVNYIMEKNI
ncbi:GNAT family N-acetyltransferase [Senegalia massiliensis]|uniref:GNAT family N-acetyltransferase n=1 Tax=Senegalia massiliensis TaxID=1720316 RepID=A0A845QWA3_9CLOT|nr:GNAT family N-acetyltransferase [Senegalia massiliensis]NBI06370.1 GNAT family N-acetyltransferase [Senegalia massiliensis]